MQDFRKLVVWKRAHSLAIRVYALTKLFPANERYGLTTQIRRCACSIPIDIAEGCGRQTSKELTRFVEIALGSASELDYQLLLAHDLGFITPSDYEIDSKSIAEIKRMLSGLRTGIQKRVASRT
ncbi:MAG: four helix bundle protein [Gemmatimonadota bacterium]|nr:four helix bundle protein [Gemmatimonadota bacterium]